MTRLSVLLFRLLTPVPDFEDENVSSTSLLFPKVLFPRELGVVTFFCPPCVLFRRAILHCFMDGHPGHGRHPRLTFSSLHERAWTPWNNVHESSVHESFESRRLTFLCA